MLDHALAYAALGIPVFPCMEKAKRPLTMHGVKDATTDEQTIRGWWARWPDANIAAAMGSGPAGAQLFAVDCDPRNGGELTYEALIDETGPWPRTPQNMTGGGGTHDLFLIPEGETIPSTKLGQGIDLISDGKYIMLPPSVHPNGRPYIWEASSDPLDPDDPCAFAAPTDALLERVRHRKAAPAWLGGSASLGGSRAQRTPPELKMPAARHALDEERVEELKAALDYIPPHDRDDWLRVGMALQSEAPNGEGYRLWCEWSSGNPDQNGYQRFEGSPKFDADDQRRVWLSFSNKPHETTAASIFRMAMDNGWQQPPGRPKGTSITAPSRERLADAPEVETVPRVVTSNGPDAPQLPEHLLHPPGILGHVVAYDLMTAPRPQPQLAVQGALAMAAVALARRYRTDMGNHPSLFLLNIAKSGSGKEHAKRVIEECLGAAGMETLIGGAGYASGVAVFSRLQSQPRHLSIIDEFGRLLEAAGRSSNEHKTAAITALMEAYGRGNGTMLPTSYSTRGMTAKEREAQEAEKVIAPNISMLSMSTPDAFYGSITDRSIQDGFLPRFIIVESSIGRQKMKKVTEVEVPDTIVEWLQYVEARAMGGGDVDGQRGNLADQAWNRADRKPPLLTIPFDDEAHQVLSDLEDRVLARQEELDREGLAEMMVRTRENAMRVALIVAMATDPTTNSIDATATKWAADYVMHYAEQAVAAVRERIASSEFGKMLQVARQVIDARGHMGGTLADLRRNSRQLRGLQPRLLSEVLEALQEEGSARLVKLKTASGRGRPREAWVHPRYITSEATDTETGAGPSQAETDPSNFRRHTGDGASTPETQQ